jgi:hypothetical protein
MFLGTFGGYLVGLGIIGSAWSGDLTFWGIPVFIIAGIVGIFLTPMLIGTFMTGIMFTSPIAAIAGFINGNSDSALTALGIGIGAFITQFVVGHVRGIR